MSLFTTLVAGAALAPDARIGEGHPVIELRQYKIVHGQRDRFIDLFDREFVETQEAEEMELVGQFRDRSDPDRFTWIRTFPSMESRQKSLTAFYSGPTWLAHRGTANPMLVDNDNVLLLRPAWPGSGFRPAARSSAKAPARLVVVSIHYLWKQPDEGFTAFFKDRLAPALGRAGFHIDAALVREESANNFPRLPVREGEKLFVWATAVESEAAWKTALGHLMRDPAWSQLRAELLGFEEREAQRLMLDPTSRSRMR